MDARARVTTDPCSADMGGGARGCTFSGGWLFYCPGAGTGRDGRPDRDWRCRASDCAARRVWGSRNRFPPARLPRSAGFSRCRAPVPWLRPPVKPSDCRMIFCSVPFWRIATCAASRLRRSLPPGSPGSAISRRRRPSVACWSAWLRARQRHRHPIRRRRHAGWRGAPVPGLDRCSCRTVTPRRSPPPECGRPTARRSLSAASPHSGSARAMPPCRSTLPTAPHRPPHCARREHSGPPGSRSAAAIAGNSPSGCAAPRWRAIRSMA